MRTKRQVARRRGLLVLVVAAVLGVGVLGVRQGLRPRAGLPAPVSQLLLECFSPVVQTAGRARNALTPDPPAPVDPLTPVSLARLRAVEDENRQLRAVLALRDHLPTGAVAAEVTARHDVPWLGTLLIDKGRADGVAPRMVALAPEGVVGMVLEVSPHTAKILPLTDPACSMGAMSERTKAPGVLKGERDGRCRLVYLTGQADVRPDDTVISSGLGGIVPKGLPLGRILSVRSDPTLSSREATVQPAVDVSTLEMVVLVQRGE